VLRIILYFFVVFLCTNYLIAKDIPKKDMVKNNSEILNQKLESFLQAGQTGFELNEGQLPKEILYRFSGTNACVDFYADKVMFGLRKMNGIPNFESPDEIADIDYNYWEVYFDNQSPYVSLIHQNKILATPIYFFVAGHRNHIQKKSFQSITYQNIYPHTDLVFYEKDGALKYDYILRPGAKISRIKMRYSNIENPTVLEDGSLSYQTKWGNITEAPPYSFLQKNQMEIDVKYFIQENIVGFSAEQDEVLETLVIDPIYVDWSTYFYGEGRIGTTFRWTWLMDVDVDSFDRVHVTGMTNDRFPPTAFGFDTVFRTQNNIYTGFICKLSPDGDSLISFSYLGGSSSDYVLSLAVNNQGEAVVAGFTISTDFPYTSGAFDTVAPTGNRWKSFVTKINASGDSIIYSSFLGGNSTTGGWQNFSLVKSMLLKNSGEVYLVGNTRSADFPVTTGALQTTYGGASTGTSWWTGGDAFLTKFASDGKSLIFSTYIGGNGDDVAYGITLNKQDEIFVVGQTMSTNFLITPGAGIFNTVLIGNSDAFLYHLNPTATTLLNGKMMGGNGDDRFESITLNDFNEPCIAGTTSSNNFPTTNGAYQRNNAGGKDFVIVQLYSIGVAVRFSTYLGGSGDEEYNYGWFYNNSIRIATNVKGEHIIGGISSSTNFPTTTDAMYSVNPSNNNQHSFWQFSGVFAKLDYRGRNLLYGSYYGGSGIEVPTSIRLKKIGCVTNMLLGGFTSSSDFPTTDGAFRENINPIGAFWTGFVSKFRDTLLVNPIQLSLLDTVVRCDIVYEIVDANNRGAEILWSTGSTDLVEILKQPGDHWVQATYGCDTVRDSIHIILEYSPQIPIFSNDTLFCDQMPTIVLDAKNDTFPATYVWDDNTTTQTRSVSDTGTYWVTISTPNCGEATDSVGFKMLSSPTLPIISDSLFCDSVAFEINIGNPLNSEDYLWSTGNDSSWFLTNETGQYWVTIENNCGFDSTSFEFSLLYTPEVNLPNDTIFCDAVFKEFIIGRADNNEVYTWMDIEKNSVVGTTNEFSTTDSGFYLTRIFNQCGLATDSIRISLLETPILELPNDSIFCDNISFTLNIPRSSPELNYVWDDGSTNTFRTISNKGTYFLNISNICGDASDTINFEQKISPKVFLTDNLNRRFQDTILCNNESVNVQSVVNIDDASYRWSNGSILSTITVNDEGNYKLVVTNECNSDSATFTVLNLRSPVINFPQDEVFCGRMTAQIIQFGNLNNQETYQWSDGFSGNERTVNFPGTYHATISNFCGSAIDSVNYRVQDLPTVSLPPDTVLCGNFEISLDAGIENVSYLWSPFGETSKTIIARDQVIYTLLVTDEYGCEGTASFEIGSGCLSTFYIPEIFSPNGDGLNDVFRPLLKNYQNFEMTILNRWGQIIAQINDLETGWDGTYKGTISPNGYYHYIIKFQTTEDMKRRHFQGGFYLIR
jgi:gliding motility-associated-like protein